MHGPGYAPPPPPRPSQGGPIALRVLFVALTVLSCGFLASASMLRLAVVTRRRRDWVLFILSVTNTFVVVYLASTAPLESFSWRDYLGMSLLSGGLVVTVVYYLIEEIRHFDRIARAPYGHTPPHPHGGPAAFGRPDLGHGYPAPGPVPHIPAPPMQSPAAPPQRPAPARIDQVRAELDELSDYLRRQEGDK
ncbi:hypothetical protein [Streptomyces sp. CRN 30]|uniref:hypothetical protein n=1 Tax=Streptomyces sp. CRN 30 TaxID=3075613 RepID=UPI002A7ECF45|nr:hypothetical protein [Streptomyces sp. CRN 30]